MVVDLGNLKDAVLPGTTALFISVTEKHLQ